jgi:gliding motility-associated-like protein
MPKSGYMKRILLFLLYLITSNIFGQAQVACGGGASPAIGCNIACISCNFNGFNGSTTGFPSGPAVGFCGTVENAQWLGFIAGAGSATFTIMPINCTHGNGVQVALYSDCTKPPLACDKGEMNGGTIPVSINVPLSPGANYFLLIDGYAGDQCDFSVSVSPPDAVYQPPLGSIQQVTGPVKLCPGATMTYTVPAVYGATGYIWNGPAGMLFDSLPSPAVIAGDKGRTVQVTMGNTSGNICVQGANTCSQTPPCGSSLYVEALTDDFKPVITVDSVQHLNCTPASVQIQAKVAPASSYEYAWTADSLGHLVSGLHDVMPIADHTGQYTFRVRDTGNGCISQKTIRVASPEVPGPVDLSLRDIRCTGERNGFLKIKQVTGGVGPFLTALDGASLIDQSEFRYLGPGIHHLLLQGANGCEWDTTVIVKEPPQLLVDLGQDTSIHLGQSIALWDIQQASDPGRIGQALVEPAGLSNYLCDTCLYTPLTSFRYQITAVDTNGCQASDSRVVAVTKSRHVFIPNIFKPEGNGGNNLFNIFAGEDVDRIKTFRVFNRWGKEVYEITNLDPGDLSRGWDGKSNGEKLPADVFVFTAEIVFKDGETEHFKGDVTLIR